jgi:hypothetical protein
MEVLMLTMGTIMDDEHATTDDNQQTTNKGLPLEGSHPTEGAFSC